MAKGTDERIRELERMLAHSPGDGASRLLLARELARAQRRGDAASHVERLLRDDPLNESALEALDEHGLSPLARGSPWPTVNGGNDRARRSSEPGARQGRLTRRIRVGAPVGLRHRGDVERVLSLSVGGDGAAYLATDQRRLVALDLASGSPRWIRELEHAFAAPSVGAGERLALASLDTVRLLDGRTGDTLWIARTSGVLDDPVPANATFAPRGLVLAPGIRGALDARDAATGRLRWSFATRGAQYAAPAVDGGTIFVACSMGSLHALDLDGRPRGEARLFASRDPVAPVVLSKAVYAHQTLDLGPGTPGGQLAHVGRTADGVEAVATRIALPRGALALGCALDGDRLLLGEPEPSLVEGKTARALNVLIFRPELAVADSAGCFFALKRGPKGGVDLGWYDSTGGTVKIVHGVDPGPTAVGPDSTLLVASERGILQVIA
jgi:hypothetical protein